MTQEQFFAEYTKGFNPQQRRAVQVQNGAALLLAVPGSGKTTVLVTRLGYLVLCCGIAPERILTVTYTVAATQEMRQRFAALFGREYGERMEFRTINGLSAKIIEYYSLHCSSRQPFALVDNEGELARIVGDVCFAVTGDRGTESANQELRGAFTYIKNEMLEEGEIRDLDLGIRRLPELYRAYCREMRQRRLMDYDDQMAYALEILRKYPQVLSYFQDCYPYLCVDESQDTSRIQHTILALLAGKHGNLFLVGDEDQSIYGFRAAFPQALLNFREDHPGAQVLLMEHNYRSVRQIVEASNAFVQQNCFRHPKQVLPVRGEGSPIRTIPCTNRATVYAYLMALAKEGEEFTVLYRNNDSALPLIDRMERDNVAYQCRPFDCGFFTHRVVEDVQDIIHFAENPGDGEIFLRIYYKLGAYLSRQAAEFACQRSAKNGRPLLEAVLEYPDLTRSSRETVEDYLRFFPMLLQRTGAEAVHMIWHTLGYGRYVEQNKLDAGKYTILMLLGAREQSPQGLLRRLEELREITKNHVSPPEARCLLSTIHSSKGLEYDRVYLLDVFDGILPAAAPEEDAQLYEEERRVFYVAMTRAREELYLFTARDRKASFVEEVQRTAGMPDAALLGKSGIYGARGKGRVVACGQTDVLVEFSGGEIRRIPREQPEAQPEPPERHTASQVSSLDAERKAVPGAVLEHKLFGTGTVAARMGSILTVRFADGERKLDLNTLVAQGLITFRETP